MGFDTSTKSARLREAIAAYNELLERTDNPKKQQRYTRRRNHLAQELQALQK